MCSLQRYYINRKTQFFSIYMSAFQWDHFPNSSSSWAHFCEAQTVSLNWWPFIHSTAYRLILGWCRLGSSAVLHSAFWIIIKVSHTNNKVITVCTIKSALILFPVKEKLEECQEVLLCHGAAQGHSIGWYKSTAAFVLTSHSYNEVMGSCIWNANSNLNLRLKSSCCLLTL